MVLALCSLQMYISWINTDWPRRSGYKSKRGDRILPRDVTTFNHICHQCVSSLLHASIASSLMALFTTILYCYLSVVGQNAVGSGDTVFLCLRTLTVYSPKHSDTKRTRRENCNTYKDICNKQRGWAEKFGVYLYWIMKRKSYFNEI